MERKDIDDTHLSEVSHISDDQKAVEYATKIYEDFGDLIYTFIRYHKANNEDVDDIYQDFFLAILKNPINPEETNMEPLLYRSIRNDVCDYARRKKTRKKYMKNYSRLINKPKQKTAQEKMMDIEEAQKMISILKKTLPRSEHNVIIRRHYEDKSSHDIARQAGLSKRTVSHYLCTGLKKIRKFVKSI